MSKSIDEITALAMARHGVMLEDNKACVAAYDRIAARYGSAVASVVWMQACREVDQAAEEAIAVAGMIVAQRRIRHLEELLCRVVQFAETHPWTGLADAYNYKASETLVMDLQSALKPVVPT